MKGLTKVKRFIKENGLDFSGTGSELNSNCTTLAGFICYVVSENKETSYEGEELIYKLDLSPEVLRELVRVFVYAWESEYEDYWKTLEARDKYTF